LNLESELWNPWISDPAFLFKCLHCGRISTFRGRSFRRAVHILAALNYDLFLSLNIMWSWNSVLCNVVVIRALWFYVFFCGWRTRFWGAFLCYGSDFGGFLRSSDVILAQVVGAQPLGNCHISQVCRGRDHLMLICLPARIRCASNNPFSHYCWHRLCH
jgi:hypothetical protein